MVNPNMAMNIWIYQFSKKKNDQSPALESRMEVSDVVLIVELFKTGASDCFPTSKSNHSYLIISICKWVVLVQCDK